MAPTQDQQRGLSLQQATDYAGCNVGAHYESDSRSSDSHRLDNPGYTRCAICDAFGRHEVAANVHHQPAKGIGGGRSTFSLTVPEGCLVRGYDGQPLEPIRPSLIAVCGSGTEGCHGRLHSGRYVLSWHWNGAHDEEAWWSGDLYRVYGEHGAPMAQHGYWTVTDRTTGEVRKLNPRRV